MIKLRKLTAFLISISMLVGLVLVAPVSAAITPAAGTYYEDNVLNIDFDTEAGFDKLTVTNGSVNEGKLEFELSDLSSLIINEGMDKSKKQHVIEFDLETENEYTEDPWSAAFIGLRLHGVDATPDGTVKGAWLGVFANKIVLWASYDGSKWGRTDRTDYYKVLDIPESITDEDGITDLSSASYKIVYANDDVEVYVKDGEAYEELVKFGVVNTDTVTKLGVFTQGGTSFETISFADAPASNYFALYNVIPEEGDNPLAPTPEEEEEVEEEEITPLKVKVDNLKLLTYNDLLATLSQIEEHIAYAELVASAYDPMPEEATVVIDEVTYRTYGIDIDAVRDFIDRFAEAAEGIENEEALKSDVDDLVSEWLTLKASFVTETAATSFISSFVGMEEALEAADPATYGADRIARVSAMIEEAKAIVGGTEVFTSAELDEAFVNVSKTFKKIGIITPNGVVTYSNSLKGALSDGEWIGLPSGTAATGSSDGYGLSWTDKLRLGYAKKINEPYSVKVTTKIVEGCVATFFGVRQDKNGSWYESTNDSWGSRITGTGGISLQSNGVDFNEIKLVLKAGITKSENNADVITVSLPITDFIEENSKEATFKFKDYGDLVEAYVIGTKGEYEGKDVKLCSVVIYPVLSDVGTFTDCHYSGRIINHLNSDEVTEFLGMAIHSMENGVIGMALRGGSADSLPDVYVKDFEIATGICVDEMTEEERRKLSYFDGKHDPLQAEFVIGNGSNFNVSIGESTQYIVEATNDEEPWIKVAGHKDEYLTGSVAVTTSDDVIISAEYGEEILTIDENSTAILGNLRGTDIVTVTYGDIASDKYLVNSMIVMEKEFGYGVVAPEEGAVFEGTIVSSAIYNSRVFRCLNVGDKVIPAISYTLGDGELRFLGTDVQVNYVSSDDSVIEYDAENGVFVAKGAGTAKIKATIPYTTLGGAHSSVTTSEVNVEVVESGADYGESMTVANADVLAAVNGEKSLAEKKQILDNAADDGISISYENDTEAELIFNAIVSAKAVNDALDEEDRLSAKEVVDKALVEAEAVISVYETINEEEATATDLETALFGSDGVSRQLGLSSEYVTMFGGLKNSKATAAMKSLLRLAKNEGTELTADFLRTKFKKVVRDQKNAEGGGGNIRVEITTDEDSDSATIRPSVPAVTVKVTTAEKYTLNEASVNAEIAKFSDAKDAPWASAAIAALSKNGVINGYEDGSIRPNETITRDEFVKLLVEAFEIGTKADGVNYYTDIPAGSWQIPFISAATDAGIVNGVDVLTFGTGMEISRQDMATMLYKAVQKYNVVLPADKIVAFLDAENIAGYAKESVNRLAAAGVVSGMGDDSFAPAQVATRAQAFQMIYLTMLLIK